MPHAEGALSIAVVCEADADRRIVCELADRVLTSEVPWIESEVLGHYRQWQGLTRADAFLKVHQVFNAARQRGLRAHGYFGNAPGAPMARMARTALLILTTVGDPPDEVIIVVDSDNDLPRRKGLEQARVERRWPFRAIVLGLAHTKRECWVLAGYVPGTDIERKLLDDLRRELGFDPTVAPELLTAQQDDAAKSAKRVLRVLTAGNPLREQACWREAALEQLNHHGTNAGLADFMAELRARFVPLFR